MDKREVYRRTVVRRRRRRLLAAAAAALLFLLLLIGAAKLLFSLVGGEKQETEQPLVSVEAVTQTWNSLSYPRARAVTIQTDAAGKKAMTARLAALPRSPRVESDYFKDAVFLGDSLTQGLELYASGLAGAGFCAYKGVGPNAVVNGTLCKRTDGTDEIPLEGLAARKPAKVYVLLGTNVLTQDKSFDSFLAYYGTMLDMIREKLPEAVIYVQSVTPVSPALSQEEAHRGMYSARFVQVNDALAALALEKGCVYLDLWEFLADVNGDLKAEYRQPDGYHLKVSGYNAWVEYLLEHTV